MCVEQWKLKINIVVHPADKIGLAFYDAVLNSRL